MTSNRSVQAALLVLFIASGCAALIYEVVWFQQLGLSLGASAVSLAIVLTSFMGGMCLGSFLLPGLVSRRWHPLAVYAGLELLLAVCGLTILWSLPAVGRFYWSFAQTGSIDLFLRATFSLLILLPPTMLMGATLPAISRAFQTDPEGVTWLGRFYSANTLGAVIGCLASGLYLLRVHDVAIATFVAVSLNLLVAAVAWSIRYQLPYQPFDEQHEPDMADSAHQSGKEVLPQTYGSAAIVGLTIGVSGLTALGSEVVWTRLLALLFGPTVYTFSLILAVFLFGLTLGSAAGSALVRRVRSPALALAVNQLLLAVAIPCTGYMIVRVLPYWWSENHDDLALVTRMLLDVARAIAALLPATILWGASFPLAIAAVSGSHRDHAIVVGRLYAANTLGAVVGALGISLLAIPLGGTRLAIQITTLLAGCSGLMMLARHLFESPPNAVGAASRAAPGASSGSQPNPAAYSSDAQCTISETLSCAPIVSQSHQLPRGSGSARRTYWGLVAMMLLGVSVAGVTWGAPTVPDGLLAWGRVVELWPQREYIHVAEGMDSAIVIADREDGMRAFHVAGKVEASTTASDMRTQRLLGHLPAMIHGRPVKVLVICCGSGMTVGSILQHPSVEKLTLCEIEYEVTVAARKYFAPQNHGALDDPRLEIVIDDGRHFLATTTEKFDLISTDPIHPWVRGAASLYTEEFYQLCKQHLNPGGIVTQWVPLYESSEAAVKCELATLLKVFPHASLYSGQGHRNGYDLIAVGMLDDSRLDPFLLTQQWYSTPEIRGPLTEVGYTDPEIFQDAFVAYGHELTDWLADAEINRDSNLRLQYLAGLTQKAQSEQGIIESLLKHRRQKQSSVTTPLAPHAD